MKNCQSLYQNRIDHYQRFYAKLSHGFNRVSTLRVFAIVFFLATAYLGETNPAQKWLFYGMSLFALGLYAFGVVVHRRLSTFQEKTQALMTVNQEALARIGDQWSEFPMTGEEFIEPQYPHLSDLNILGKGSLFQMIQLCATRMGAKRLAHWLSFCDDFSEIDRKQLAVKELKAPLSFRQHFLAEGRVLKGPLDPTSFLSWIASPSLLIQRPWLVYLQRGLVMTTWTLLVLNTLLDFPPFWMLGVLLQLIVFSLTTGSCREHYLPAVTRDSAFLAYGAMFGQVEEKKFTSSVLKGIQSRCFINGKKMSVQMRKLERINSCLGFYSSLMHPIVNILFLWDIHFLYQLEHWKKSTGQAVEACFEALGEMEALCSLAGFSSDYPDYDFPQIDSKNSPLVAEGLGHPLIPSGERVHNDFQLPSEGFLALITGSNMSGKSTFIRTIGVNMALAFSGAPVAAHRFRARPCRIQTCIQIFDSLRLNISHFYAEVQTIKRILDSVAVQDGGQEPLPVLYLIDEIFSGTNTKERLIASRGILRKLADSRSYGLVTTHDLELVELEKQSPKIKNFHFKDDVDEDGRMVFHYHIHDGPVSSTNALKLLKREGILF